VENRKREISYSWATKKRRKEIEEAILACLKVQEIKMI